MGPTTLQQDTIRIIGTSLIKHPTCLWDMVLIFSGGTEVNVVNLGLIR